MYDKLIEYNKTYPVWFDKSTFVTTFLATLLIHGQILFNKMSFWDDVIMLQGLDWNIVAFGRWFYHLMNVSMRRFIGIDSIPFFLGAIVALCIAIMACVSFYLFDINNKKQRLALIIIFAAIPSIAGHFGYMFCSALNFIGMLICVMSAYCISKTRLQTKKSISSFFVASLLFALALGEYQCYFAFYLSVLLIYLIKQCVTEDITLKNYFLTGFKYIASAIVGLIFYLMILQIFLKISHLTLASYANVNTYGIVSVEQYLKRICFAYQVFINPIVAGSANMFPFRKWYIVLLIIIVMITVLFLGFNLYRKKYQKCLQIMVALLLLPAVLNFNFILYGFNLVPPPEVLTAYENFRIYRNNAVSWRPVHALHMYHLVLLFILPFIFANALRVDNNSKNIGIFKKIVLKVAISITFLWGVLYVWYDNYCYTINEMRQSKAISYFSILISRIQSVDGYKPDYPVTFINEFNKINSIDIIENQNNRIITVPYLLPIVNSYNWTTFMYVWCGYRPKVYADPRLFLENDEVFVMPLYPADGSIKIINGTVVVKF